MIANDKRRLVILAGHIDELTAAKKSLYTALCTGQVCKYIIIRTPERYDIESSKPPPLGDGENTLLNESPMNFTSRILLNARMESSQF